MGGAPVSTEQWTEPRAVVVGSVEWRCVTLAEGADGSVRFGATGHSGRATRGTVPYLDGATLEERIAAGLRRVQHMSWTHPREGVAYLFRLEPGAPPRTSVSTRDGGIHVVPLPPGRFLTGLADKSLMTLVQQALDRRERANWASEGGAVSEPSGGKDAPEV